MAGRPAAAVADLGAPAQLDLMVRLGLAWYIRRIEDPEPALRLLCQEGEVAARQAALFGLEWRQQRLQLAAAWERAEEPLSRLAGRLSLSPADLFLLGLVAACERRSTVALAVAALQAPIAAARPTVHLALDLAAVLFETGPDDALGLAFGPLADAGLISFEGEDALPQRILTVNLALWRVLAGGPPAWPGCTPISLPLPASPPSMPPLALERAARAIAGGEAGGVVVRGPPGCGRRAIAASLAEKLGRLAIEAPAAVFRGDRAFATACQATGWMPVLRVSADLGETVRVAGSGDPLPVVVLAGAHGAIEGDRLLELAIAPPGEPERARLWRAALGEWGDGIDPAVLSTAVLYPDTIAAVGRAARIRADSEARRVVPADIAEARRALAPDGLSGLAHPVVRAVEAEALITTPQLAQDLAALISRCRRREAIWNGLGPSLAASATRGVRVLFAGESGTGKTMAASYVATALAAPLFRCDLAAVMNKYIGESEKNLGNLLDHAEAADVVLLFDEADALFGRRSEGTETGERYANMLTNYLLTRLEAHNGIVILTANAKARIDPAFWRRLDQVIDFPMPGYAERLALWKGHLGGRAPSEAVLERLAAYCDLSGGGVRNAVLAAAAIADPEGPIGLDCLTPALQREYAKLRRALPAALALAVRSVA